jgi:hypothetical protein
MIKINPIQTDKCHIEQPEAVKNGILPGLPASYLIVGRSGSGKSTNVANLLTSPELLGGYFNFVVVFSDVTCDDVLKHALKLPPENIICGEDFTEDAVKDVLEKMRKIVDEMGIEKACKEFKVAIIFDDILSRAKLLRSDIMRKMFTANRHYLVSVFILSQYLKSIPPVIRQNVSGLVFYPSSLMEIEKLAEENCEPFMNKKQFIQIVEHACDEKHSFLFINRKAEAGHRLRKGYNMELSLGGGEERSNIRASSESQPAGCESNISGGSGGHPSEDDEKSDGFGVTSG